MHLSLGTCVIPYPLTTHKPDAVLSTFSSERWGSKQKVRLDHAFF